MSTHCWKLAIYVGPTTVRRMANLVRLHLAGTQVYEGTEHIWIRVHADTIEDAQRIVRTLPCNIGLDGGRYWGYAD